MDCGLCKHNPHKTCATAENFDEAYADNQVLRARCDADVCVELFNASTGEVFSAPGVEVQVRLGGGCWVGSGGGGAVVWCAQQLVLFVT